MGSVHPRVLGIMHQGFLCPIGDAGGKVLVVYLLHFLKAFVYVFVGDLIVSGDIESVFESGVS